VPNGRSEELEELKAIRAVSVFWAAVWQIGDLAPYVAFFGVFLAPMISVLPLGAASLAQYLLRAAIAVGIAIACIPAAVAVKWALQALSRRQTGVRKR